MNINLGIIVLVTTWFSVAIFGFIYAWYIQKNPPENIANKVDKFRRIQLMRKYKHLFKK